MKVEAIVEVVEGGRESSEWLREESMVLALLLLASMQELKEQIDNVVDEEGLELLSRSTIKDLLRSGDVNFKGLQERSMVLLNNQSDFDHLIDPVY